jgi:hypothetical protein
MSDLAVITLALTALTVTAAVLLLLAGARRLDHGDPYPPEAADAPDPVDAHARTYTDGDTPMFGRRRRELEAQVARLRSLNARQADTIGRLHAQVVKLHAEVDANHPRRWVRGQHVVWHNPATDPTPTVAEEADR